MNVNPKQPLLLFLIQVHTVSTAEVNPVNDQRVKELLVSDVYILKRFAKWVSQEQYAVCAVGHTLYLFAIQPVNPVVVVVDIEPVVGCVIESEFVDNRKVTAFQSLCDYCFNEELVLLFTGIDAIYILDLSAKSAVTAFGFADAGKPFLFLIKVITDILVRLVEMPVI